MHNEAGSGQVFHIRFAHIPICLLIQRAFRWLVDCKSWNSCLRLPLTEFAATVPSVPGYIYLFPFADMLPDGPVLALSLLLVVITWFLPTSAFVGQRCLSITTVSRRLFQFETSGRGRNLKWGFSIFTNYRAATLVRLRSLRLSRGYD